MWPSSKGKHVLGALLRIGWQFGPGDKKGGSHRKLIHPHLPNYTWAFADSTEIGPVMLAKIAKHTGLKPEHL